MKVHVLSLLGLPSAMALVAATGCSGSPAPAAQAFVSASVSGGSITGVNDTQVCGSSVGLQLQLGNAVQPLPVVVTDGTSQAGQKVHVSCKVDGSGTFSVELAATVDGMGSFFLKGSNIASSGTTNGLQGSYTNMGITYSDANGCVLSYSYDGTDLPKGGAPTSGRMWAHVECDHATVNGLYSTLPDGTMVQRTCQLNADFLFQNCT
jgi:hypothetical protein